MDNLSKRLREYTSEDIYPFHMPGHKRMPDMPYKLDITEIEGFDNLNNPKGILRSLNEDIAKMYGSKTSYFTVNGSTCGNLSAVSAVAKPGDMIVVARNCHKSVFNAAYIRGLEVEYVMPDYLNESVIGEVKLSEIKGIVRQCIDCGKKPKAVVLTSPTYEGVVSDIPSISRYLHSLDIPLIVDSAHGAHLFLHREFPEDCVEDIDICIMSAHKTLPVLNQGAIVHVNSDLINPEDVMRFLKIYQTSSPSYVIMESMSRAIEIIAEKDIDKYIEELKNFYEEAKTLEKLSLEPISKGRDMSKILIYTNGYIHGDKLCNILRNRYKIELEMHCRDYVLAMSSIMDTREGFVRLIDGLRSIDRELTDRIFVENTQKNPKILRSHLRRTKTLDINRKFGLKPITESLGIESAGMIVAYPPGIPILMPGEIIENDDIDFIANNYEIIEGIVDGKLPVIP